MTRLFVSLSFIFLGAACAASTRSQTGDGSGGGTGGGGAGGTAGTGNGGSAAGAAPVGGGGQGTSGAGASGGTGTGGSTSGSIFDGPPSPPTATAKFPFPQNRAASGCVYPSAAANADVQAGYDHWKTLVVTANGAGGELRVQRAENGGDTVSEGIGYGMIAAVYMNDQPTFDKLWRYEQKFSDQNGLMNWQINAAGTAAVGTGSATDADEDMAWALVMADRQWGGQGTLTGKYIDIAKGLIAKIWQFDVDHGRGEMLKPGDGWMQDKTNPSYFAPAYYRVFGTVTADANWMKVVDSSYAIITKSLTQGNSANGLVPDWCSSAGAPDPASYGYDACRTPFRIALDACLFSEAPAQSYLAKTSQFFSGLGAANIKDGYMLNGTPTGTSLKLAFLGPAAVGAMSQTSDMALVNDGYRGMATLTRLESTYYNASWGVLSLLMMTGNFLDYTQLP
jgi:endo-1,4-beta-D-glucanase Y